MDAKEAGPPADSLYVARLVEDKSRLTGTGCAITGMQV
jgi:hypothetical protein